MDGLGVEIDAVQVGRACLGDGAEGLLEDGGETAGLVAGLGVVVDGAAVARGVLLPPVDAVDETPGDFGSGRATCEKVFGAVDLGSFREDGGAAVADEDVDSGAQRGVGADAGVGVRASALETEDERGGGDFGAPHLVRLLEQLVDGGDSLPDGDGCAAVFLNSAGAEGAGISGESDEGFDLVGLAAEAEEKNSCEVGVRGVADEDATEEVGGFAVFGHAASGSMSDGDDSVNMGIGGEDLRREVGSDATGYGGGAVDCGEDADVVAGADAAVGADDALEGDGRIKEFDWVGFGADGVVAFEVSGNEVVSVDELADSDGLGGKANDLIEFTDGFSGGDGVDRQFVSCGDIGKRSQVHAVERLARGDRLEGDHNVVRASEFESMVTQTILLSPLP